MCLMTEHTQLKFEAQKLNDELKGLASAEERIRFVLRWGQERKQNVVQTTSFGIQSCLMLDLLHKAGGSSYVPVVWIDTGYLPPDTYIFASEMEERYSMDLRVYQATVSPARMEAIYGKLWEDPSDTSHRLYNTIRKVEPMQQALQDTGASLVLTGLRANQTKHRQSLQFVNVDGNRLKVCPILDWSDENVQEYFETEMIPYHPLHFKGYRTVGDSHSSEPYDPSIHESERDTRFHGRLQECGLHTSTYAANSSSVSLTRSDDSSSSSSIEEPSEPGFVIYGRRQCRFCRAAKALIKDLSQELEPGVSVHELEVGHSISKEELEKELGLEVTTVPQVMYKGVHIGGYQDLVAWGKAKYEPTKFLDIISAIVLE